MFRVNEYSPKLGKLFPQNSIIVCYICFTVDVHNISRHCCRDAFPERCAATTMLYDKLDFSLIRPKNSTVLFSLPCGFWQILAVAILPLLPGHYISDNINTLVV